MKGKHQLSVSHRTITALAEDNAKLRAQIEELRKQVRLATDADFLRQERARLTARVHELERDVTELPKLRSMLEHAQEQVKDYEVKLGRYRNAIGKACQRIERTSTAEVADIGADVMRALGLKFRPSDPVDTLLLKKKMAAKRRSRSEQLIGSRFIRYACAAIENQRHPMELVEDEESDAA